MRKNRYNAASLLIPAFLLYCLPTVSFGWGPQGHEAIVKIAFKLMPKDRQERFYKILGSKDASFIGNWADRERQARPETGPWHFVNIPKEAHGYDAARDCKNGCLISELAKLQGELKSKDIPQRVRREDLLYLIHLIGDLYQPYHNIGDDAGATQLLVDFDGEKQSLHKVWDSGIIEAHVMDEKTLHELYLKAKKSQSHPPEMDMVKISMRQHRIAVSSLQKQGAVLPANYAEVQWPTVELALISAALQIVESTKDM